jgi:hypothetical protein
MTGVPVVGTTSTGSAGFDAMFRTDTRNADTTGTT